MKFTEISMQECLKKTTKKPQTLLEINKSNKKIKKNLYILDLLSYNITRLRAKKFFTVKSYLLTIDKTCIII